MKKLAAILLTGVLFFNWCGYRLLFAWWQHEAASRLQTRLDGDDYDEASLISIKIPVTCLSYYNPSTHFEKIEGEIILGDAAYKYVKRRIINDSLELLCVRNTDLMQLRAAGNDFFKLINDLLHYPGSKTGSSRVVKTIFSPADLRFTITTLAPIPRAYAHRVSLSLSTGYSLPAEHPPDPRIAS